MIKKPVGYVYETFCLITRKFYVGQHNFQEFHPYYLGSGKKILEDIEKYGRKHFKNKLIKFYFSRKALDQGEKDSINKYTLKYGKKRMYNISFGGSGWNNIGVKLGPCSSERIEKIRKGNLGKHSVKMSDETKEKIRKSLSGRKRPPRSKEWCKKISDAKKGKKHTLQSRINMGRSHIGLKHSLKTREKMRKAWVIHKQRENLVREEK